jgi:hypothetical protein
LLAWFIIARESCYSGGVAVIGFGAADKSLESIWLVNDGELVEYPGGCLGPAFSIEGAVWLVLKAVVPSVCEDVKDCTRVLARVTNIWVVWMLLNPDAYEPLVVWVAVLPVAD